MTSYEYYSAKARLEKIIKRREEHSLDIENYIEFTKYVELLVAVKGHAWCMDVGSERKKISKLLANATYTYFKLAD